jgi:general secretion pathway protein L
MLHLLVIIFRELHGFGAWWFAELRGLVPPLITRSRRKHRQQLVLTLQGQEVTLSKRGGGHEQRLGAAKLGSPAQVEALRAMLRRTQGRERRITLRLGLREGLRRVLDLPLAAREDLGELLRLGMDRLSPFAADEVHFAYRLIASDPGSRRIQVELQLAPKRVIDQALAVAARFEVAPDSVELAAACADPEVALNLLPQRKSGSALSLLDRALIGASALVVAAVIGLDMYLEGSVAKDLERQAAAAKGPAEESLALIERLDEIRLPIHFLTERKSKKSLAVEVLDELTRLIPDEAYVVQLTIRANEVQLHGLAKDAARLIRSLNRSTLFREARFLSPITQDSVEIAERFHIAVALGEAD